MSLLLDAAKQWRQLLHITYIIQIGRKGQSQTLHLVFREVDFDHLSGIHYANDVDFKLHRREYRGEKLLQAVCTGKIDPLLIEKSAQWPKISRRLTGILNIHQILNSDFKIYRFSASKLPFYSKISAYLLYSDQLGKGFFLFLDERDQQYYCKSIFDDDELDYTLNQTGWVILEKAIAENGTTTVIYRSPTYTPKP